MEQLTQEQAIAFAKSDIWKEWSDQQIVELQLFQRRLCVDFSRFHQAIESVLGRPVYTTEFGNPDRLIKEYFGENPKPTFQEIMNLIPEEKRDELIKNIKV